MAPAGALLLAVVPRRVVAQAPGTQIDAAAQVGVIVAAVVAPAVAVELVAAAEAVIEQGGGNAVVPLGWGDIAARIAQQRRLRETDVQPLAADVRPALGLRNDLRQRDTGVGRLRAQGGKGRGPHPQLVQFARRQAGLQPLVAAGDKPQRTVAL
ncbi:hypothetical protein D3C75_847620 [compost metagenome]